VLLFWVWLKIYVFVVSDSRIFQILRFPDFSDFQILRFSYFQIFQNTARNQAYKLDQCFNIGQASFLRYCGHILAQIFISSNSRFCKRQSAAGGLSRMWPRTARAEAEAEAEAEADLTPWQNASACVVTTAEASAEAEARAAATRQLARP
jgi:hypothetical protein